MKIRIGFISNSSSSSFIVKLKTKKLPEIIEKHNKKLITDYGGKENITRYQTDKKILSMHEIEYGAEETVKDIVEEILINLGYKLKDIEIEIGD